MFQSSTRADQQHQRHASGVLLDQMEPSFQIGVVLGLRQKLGVARPLRCVASSKPMAGMVEKAAHAVDEGVHDVPCGWVNVAVDTLRDLLHSASPIQHFKGLPEFLLGIDSTQAQRLVLAATLLGAMGLPVHAESLRCNGRSTSLGDSRLSVLRTCGEPTLKDSFCAPIYAGPSVWQPLPQPFASSIAPCLQIDEWLYDRGPGHLSATVRFRYGVVQSITYGQATPP